MASAVALCAACVTPTLPPDDPPRPEVQLGEGFVLLSGVVPSSPASVFARNRSTGLIFGQTTPDGFYEFEVEGAPCDPLDFWYTSRGYQSSPLRLVPAELVDPPLPRSDCRPGPASLDVSDAAAPALEGPDAGE